jgi:hypothetical protein
MSQVFADHGADVVGGTARRRLAARARVPVLGRRKRSVEPTCAPTSGADAVRIQVLAEAHRDVPPGVVDRLGLCCDGRV